MVMRPVWISVYGCLAPAFLRFGGGGYYHYPVLGTELAAVLKARGEGWTAFLSVREISHFLQLLDITPRMVEPVMTPLYRLRFRPWFRGRESACRPQTIKARGGDSLRSAPYRRRYLFRLPNIR